MRLLLIGATSAIAHAAARPFATERASFFLVGRSTDKLNAVAADLTARGAALVDTYAMDANDFDQHAPMLAAAQQAMGGIDAVLIAHGTLPDQAAAQASVPVTLEAFETNATSVIALLTRLANHFEQQRRGTIAVIASVAGDRGRPSNYVYGSAKGAVAVFLQGLRARLFPFGVAVVTIKPGFVDTPMTAHLPKNPLYAAPADVGARIHKAMKRGESVVYVPGFWRGVMGLIKAIPEPVFKRLKL